MAQTAIEQTLSQQWRKAQFSGQLPGQQRIRSSNRPAEFHQRRGQCPRTIADSIELQFMTLAAWNFEQFLEFSGRRFERPSGVEFSYCFTSKLSALFGSPLPLNLATSG